MKGNSIAGRKRNDGIDYYQTPPLATVELLKRETFVGNILEPRCGAGAISKILETYGYVVHSSDIRKDDSVYGIKGIDIFNIKEQYDNVVTNPPYFCAKEVAEQSLKIAKNKVAMILKLVFLESDDRYSFFKNTPLKSIYVFCKRVQMYPEGTAKPKNSGTIAYAWFVWDKQYVGKPMVEWII